MQDYSLESSKISKFFKLLQLVYKIIVWLCHASLLPDHGQAGLHRQLPGPAHDGHHHGAGPGLALSTVDQDRVPSIQLCQHQLRYISQVIYAEFLMEIIV